MADLPARPRVEGQGTFTALLEEVVRGSGQAAAAWASGLGAGEVVGRYELVREIGRGGSAVVFEARDRELGRTVAFKALRATGEATRDRRLLAEAEVAARLSHPNIVTVLDVGRGEHGVFLVQEYLSGRTLADRLAEGPIALREAMRIGVELARGLAHAHAQGIVHRDLSPRNVQLCDDGQVKLLDLGMAAAFGRRKLEGGTPAYMAPEQAAGAPEDERTDVWALGALLYRMLTGVTPVTLDADGRPRSAPRGVTIPEAPALADLLEAMLSLQPTARPRDASEVLLGLQEIATALPGTAPTGTGRARVRPPGRTRWILTGLAAGLVVAAALAVPLGLWIGARAKGGAALQASSRVFSGSSASRPCTWSAASFPTRHDFDVVPSGARWRNGEFGGQELTRIDGRGAWRQFSDWNQLYVPLARPLPDPFAIEASFLVPAKPDGTPQVSLHVFTDPTGPMDRTSSLGIGGRTIDLMHAPGGVPTYTWWRRDEKGVLVPLQRGNLGAPFTGGWHVLRIEGSRAEGWARALLDGFPLVIETGALELGGGQVVLGGNGPAYTPADVLWRALEIRQGTGDCR